MQVNEFNQSASILALSQVQQIAQLRPQAGLEDAGADLADSFTNSGVSIPMLSGMYDMSGSTVGGIPPVAASNEAFEGSLNAEEGGFAGGGSPDGGEEESKTRIVVEGGVTYMETTTTTNGVTTITRTILDTGGRAGNLLSGFGGINPVASEEA